jgi:phosphopentomutase
MVSAAGITDVKLAGRSARVTTRAAQPVLDRFDCGLAFLYLKDCDIAGHAHGWMSDEYKAAAAEVDAAIGSISSLTEHDLLIVTADHGGGGVDPKDHDATHAINARIPLVMAGPGVARNRIIGSKVSILDIPPTILWAFGLHAPSQYEGRVLVDAFSQTAEMVRVHQC